MAKMLKGLKGLWIVLALAAVLTIAGCSDITPLSPDTDGNASLGKPSLTIGKGDVETAVEVSQVISASDGGVIVIETGLYSHSFEVEEGAISSDIVISAAVSEGYVNRRKAVIFEFGPDGLVFSKAATLVFDTDELSSTDNIYNFYYYDTRAGEWVLQASKFGRRGEVEFDVNHFSKYAISD